VASPEPLEIVEEPAIRALVDAGVIVIALGGGGVPVVRRLERLEGIEAVIDKDLASAPAVGIQRISPARSIRTVCRSF